MSLHLRKDDDAHFPMQGKGRKANHQPRHQCEHKLLITLPDGMKICHYCGRPVTL